MDTSDQNEVRICYHRNCVTFDFYNQLSLEVLVTCLEPVEKNVNPQSTLSFSFFSYSRSGEGNIFTFQLKCNG